MKFSFKKIAPFVATAVMLGATAAAANYPAPFSTTGASIVVGGSAPASDLVAATKIVNDLVGYATPTSTSSSVSGGKAQDVTLGGTLAGKLGSTLTATDLAGFQDTSVTIDTGNSSNSYNVKDEVDFDSASPIITTGLAQASTAKEWGKDIWMTISASGKISYKYVFKTALKTNNYIVNASTNSPIDIVFLGKNLRITGATATGITAQIATEYYLTNGGSVTVEGKTVKLVDVSSTSVIVDVDGVQGTISGSTTTKVNGIRIQIKSTFASDTKTDRAATLYIGTDVSKSYNSGDAYIGQDTDNPDWTWNLAALDTSAPTIGVQYAKSAVTPSGTNKPVKMGDSISAPDNYFKISVGDATTSSYKDYSFNGLAVVDLYNGSNVLNRSAANALEITASGGGKNGFNVTVGAGTKYTDKIAVVASNVTASTSNVTVYWANPDQGWHYQMTDSYITNVTATPWSTITAAGIVTPDTSAGIPIKVSVGAGARNVNVSVFGLQKINQTILLDSNGNISYLGGVTGTATAGDLYVDTTDVSTLDAEGRTKDGIVISNMKSNGDSDQLKLSVPSKVGTDFGVRVTVTSAGSSVTGSSGGGAVGFLVLDKDMLPADKAKDLIVVGGSCINTVAAKLLGSDVPKCGAEWTALTNVSANQAIVKVFNNPFTSGKIAMLVAGYEAADSTKAATYIIEKKPSTDVGTSMRLSTASEVATIVA